ncbi:laminin subunit alpha-3 isoform X2 [Poecilia formosa]|uniref:laminin subunit alpha-3 isoform X2 n=1 Tax=Poecilia formosa TaxID=48698 RepID=UPI0004440244|nr:PREDICTED: laminin subunit alpha-3-like isoform X2 [Poecilia formosa]
MKQKAPLLCFALWLFFSFAPICLCAQSNSKGWHDRDTRWLWKKSGTKKFCDPSVSDHTASAVPECSPGFYRERTGPSKGRCVPCRCNGLSDLCDAQTGNCMNCRFDTVGDRCERCREGFHGHAPNRTCRACPCPSTHNNFAVACLDVSPGVVECLCKRGYSGARCERCAFGYYGNPMVPGDTCKPCSCADSSLSGCDSLTGECATGANGSGGDPCHGCDGCACALLVDLEKEDGGVALLCQLVLNITAGLPGLSLLEADASQTKLRVDGYSGAVRWLDPNVEQLEADIALVGNDLTRQNNEMPDITLDLEKALKNVNRTVIQVEDFLFKAVALIHAANGLAEQQASPKHDVSSSLSDGQKSQMMEEAEQIMAEIKDRRCAIQGAGADGEQDGARMLLENIRADIGDLSQTVQAALKPTADVLTPSNVSVMAVAEQLLSVQETVEKAQRLNLEGATGLENLQTALAALWRERSSLLPAMERIYDTMKKTKDALFMTQKIKNEEESLAAQVDGGKLELLRKLNATWKCATQTDAVTRAEEHAEELGAAAAELRQVHQNVANSRELLRIFGAHDSVARLSQAANQALRDVKEGGLIISAEEMEDVSADLHAEANDTRWRFKTVSRALNAQRDGVRKQEKKAETLKASVLNVGGSIRQIERDDTKGLVEFVKITTSAVNAKVSKVKERLGNIRLEMRRIPSASFSGNFLTVANRAVKRLNRAMPVLEDKLEQMQALGANTSASANVMESIERIKDIIDETRSFVNRLSLATIFNGKSYIELHPPRNLEDIKAFTAVDLLLSLHHGDPIAARRRRQRQHKNRDESSHFVLYLGNRDTFGDYFAMVIRNTKLICLYKLGGVVHEVETSQISTGNTSSSYFDRIVFQRVYQDATVSITKNFTSQKPVSLPPKQNLPNTTSGVMILDSQRAVFYVGGYPEEFHPPEELRYPKYRGAMKLSYINDVPVNLFNYKRAVNMQTKQRTAKISQTELCDYYDGTGYRMAFLKEPQKEKRRLFRFNTSSRETNALLFYIGNEESFFCVCVERGFLVLEGQQGGRQLRNQSSAQVSLFEKKFEVMIADRFVVRYGSEQIHTDHIQTNYTRWYMGGLPAWLRRRHNITAAPLRGCVDHVTADAEIVEYDKTVGVRGGCPVSLLGVRVAAVYSALPADSLSVCSRQSRVSLGFSSTSRHAVLLNCGSQSFTSGHDLQLSLTDGFLIFRRYNYTVTSGKRYNDGAWHYLSAEGRPTGLVLSIDNVNVIQKQEPRITRPEEKFKGCIANLYARRNDSKFIPADLSSLSHTADVFPGWCSLKFQSLAGTHCSRQQPQYEHQFSEASWLSYTLPEEELNYRPHFSLHIKTNSSKGLILHVAGRGVVPRLALYMANGKIRMSLGQDRVIQHKKKSNDGGWHMVEFSVENSTFHLLVDGVRVPDGQLPGNEGSSLQLRSPVYLGGHPQRKTTKVGHDIPADGVIGCLRDFRMNNVAAPAPDSSRDSLPCSGGLTETGTFFGGGHVLLDNFFTDGSRFVLSFEMRPQHLTGLLFHFRSDGRSSLHVYLMENGVGVGLNDATGSISVTVPPRESLCDGKFHAVTVSRQRSVIELAVDSESKQETHSSTSDTYSTLYIGGTAHQHGVPVPSPFVGCLRHLEINGKPLGLETESEVFGVVSLNRCPAG